MGDIYVREPCRGRGGEGGPGRGFPVVTANDLMARVCWPQVPRA